MGQRLSRSNSVEKSDYRSPSSRELSYSKNRRQKLIPDRNSPSNQRCKPPASYGKSRGSTGTKETAIKLEDVDVQRPTMMPSVHLISSGKSCPVLPPRPDVSQVGQTPSLLLKSFPLLRVEATSATMRNQSFRKMISLFSSTIRNQLRTTQTGGIYFQLLKMRKNRCRR